MRFLLFALFLSIGISAIGQVNHRGLDKISPEVKASFSKKYPATSEEIWTNIDHSVMISFKSGLDYYDAFFNKSGKWLRTEKAILFDQLPKNIQDSLNASEFNTWEKGSVYKVEMPGISESYKIYVYSKDWNELELDFDKTGKRIIQ